MQHPDSECECRCHRRDGIPFNVALRMGMVLVGVALVFVGWFVL